MLQRVAMSDVVTPSVAAMRRDAVARGGVGRTAEGQRGEEAEKAPRAEHKSTGIALES